MARHRPAQTRQASNASFATVLRNPVFALLFAADLQSRAGDQLARVALSVLVFEATGSAPATAATYAATLLPTIFGGVVMARIGDRLSRRDVMIACDLFRAGCFAAMVVPGVPLGVLIALVVVAVVADPVFSAAEISYVATVLGDEQYRAASGLWGMAGQAAQGGGFVFGGALVATIGARPTLAVDAVTFVLSAVLVAVACTRKTSRPVAAVAEPVTYDAGFRPWCDKHVRNLTALALLIGFFVVPEGLAVPFGDEVGGQTWQVGMLLGAGALGGALGAAFIVSAVRADRRPRVSRAMAIACGLPLVLTPITDLWQVAAAAWFVSGFFAAYMVETSSAATVAVPDACRASFVGTVGALTLAAQGAGLIVFGVLAQWTSAGVSIAVAGVSGSVLAVVAARAAGRSQHEIDVEAERQLSFATQTSLGLASN